MSFDILLGSITQVFLWTVPFLLVLGVVVVVHELGHFWAARGLGVTVETFSIGFGPEIVGFHDRKGTRWRLAWIPLGGYVKFKGDDNVASVPPREHIESLTPSQRVGNFHTAPLWRRTLIVLAGPFANFALCIVILTGWFMANGIAYREARITCVEPGLPAAQAGLVAGDKVLSVSGTEVRSFDDLRRLIVLNARSELDLLVERGGQTIQLRAVPKLTEQDCIGQLGVQGPTRPEDVRRESLGFGGAFVQSVETTWINIVLPFKFIAQLIRGNACANQLGGPVKIAETTKDVATLGFINLIPLIAFISVSVGLFNLFPIPVLDGGHLLYYGAEAILGRPLSQQAQDIGLKFGLSLLLLLTVLVTYNNIADLTRKKDSVNRVASVCRG